MPFESEAQRRWMYANDPEMAKRWQAHTPKGVKLPTKKRKAKPNMKALPANLKDMPVEKAAELLAMQKQANILRSLGDSTALRGVAKSVANVVRSIPEKAQGLATQVKDTASHFSDPANWNAGHAALGGAALGALGGAGTSLFDRKKRKHLLHNTLAGALAGGAVGGGAKMVADSDWLTKALSSVPDKDKTMGGVTDPGEAAVQQAAAKMTPEVAAKLQQDVGAATSIKPDLATGAAALGTLAAGGAGIKYIGKPGFNMWNKAHPDFQEIAARTLPQPPLPGVDIGDAAASAAPKLSGKDKVLAAFAKLRGDAPVEAPKLQPGVVHQNVNTTAKALAEEYKQNPGAAIGSMKARLKGELPMITRMQRLSRWVPRKAKYTGGAVGLLALLAGGYHVQDAVSNYIGQMYKDRSDAAARLAETTAKALQQK